MKRSDKDKKSPLNPFIIALLMSLLLHQLFLSTLGEFWPTPNVEPLERTEVTLREVPIPQPKQEKKPESVAQPAFKPRHRLEKKEKVAKKKTPPKPPDSEEMQVAIEPEPVGPPEPEITPKMTPRQGELKTDFNWGNFEQVFGAESATDREQYKQAMLERRRGHGRYGRFTDKIKKALNAKQGWVRPGNQEPLGDRREIFHAYIRRIHEESIHPLFADSFWESLPSLGANHPLNDWSLRTLAEFEIFESGEISEVRVVQTSGNTVFDAAAVDSVYRSSPFPPPPKTILSWNKRVYLRWGFYRSYRKCGVFNVEPYILAAPGAEKEKISIDDFIKQDG